MPAAEGNGQPQDHRHASQVCPKHPENHPVHEDGMRVSLVRSNASTQYYKYHYWNIILFSDEAVIIIAFNQSE